MLGRAFKIGTVLGFRIELSVSFLIVLGAVAVFWGLGGLLAVPILVSGVLLHELGHAVVARRLGVPILGIELHALGGAAKMARMPRSARDEVLIAIAGPIVSLVLGGSALLATALLSGLPSHPLRPETLLGGIALLNVMLGVFNMVPALPMDGGRVLRAFLAGRIGRYRATLVAATVAQGIAIAMVVVAIFYSRWMLLMVAIFVWFLAAQERAVAGMWRYEDELPQAEVLGPDGQVIYRPAGEQMDPRQQGVSAEHFLPDSAATGGQGQAAGSGRRVRFKRLPNGQVVIIEESIRW